MLGFGKKKNLFTNNAIKLHVEPQDKVPTGHAGYPVKQAADKYADLEQEAAASMDEDVDEVAYVDYVDDQLSCLRQELLERYAADQNTEKTRLTGRFIEHTQRMDRIDGNVAAKLPRSEINDINNRLQSLQTQFNNIGQSVSQCVRPDRLREEWTKLTAELAKQIEANRLYHISCDVTNFSSLTNKMDRLEAAINAKPDPLLMPTMDTKKEVSSLLDICQAMLVVAKKAAPYGASSELNFTENSIKIMRDRLNGAVPVPVHLSVENQMAIAAQKCCDPTIVNPLDELRDALNETIEELRNDLMEEIEGTDANVESLEGDISDLQDRVNALEDEENEEPNQEINERLESLESDVASLEEKIDDCVNDEVLESYATNEELEVVKEDLEEQMTTIKEEQDNDIGTLHDQVAELDSDMNDLEERVVKVEEPNIAAAGSPPTSNLQLIDDIAKENEAYRKTIEEKDIAYNSVNAQLVEYKDSLRTTQRTVVDKLDEIIKLNEEVSRLKVAHTASQDNAKGLQQLLDAATVRLTEMAKPAVATDNLKALVVKMEDAIKATNFSYIYKTQLDSMLTDVKNMLA